MSERFEFTAEERLAAQTLWATLRSSCGIDDAEEVLLRQHLNIATEQGTLRRDIFGLNPVVTALQTALLGIEEAGLRHDGVVAILLNSCLPEDADLEDVGSYPLLADDSVRLILRGLRRIQGLYRKSGEREDNGGASSARDGEERGYSLPFREGSGVGRAVESENFRNLLLSYAGDMRVILILIARQVALMRGIRDTANDGARRLVSHEAAMLYAPLAHKLGLYKLKSELEDLSLKYLETEAYYMIREKLNATKRSRDAYIARFIAPIEKRLKKENIVCHIKGRTKSIHSIWQKMQKQGCGFEGVYDLFAIRIIIDCPPEREKELCWRVFAYVTELTTYNPSRTRDWLTVPKKNGYESLHTTIMGPEGKWVEVQIRSERMDEVAERGVAAHWRYKGVKAEDDTDGWLGSIRQMLEEKGEKGIGREENRIEREVKGTAPIYVFSPRGDLFKLAHGATVLDFAYHVHSNVGNACTGARINGRIVPIREELHSGDTVEIITHTGQRPKLDWLNIVKTSRARAKLRLALKETQAKDAQLTKEKLERKFRNRKIELKESLLAQTIRRMGFKVASDFYKQLAEERIDMNAVVEKYEELQDIHSTAHDTVPTRSAQEFVLDETGAGTKPDNDDVLVIDRNVKGIDFSLAKCCHPIYCDRVFGFVTSGGGIKIHRDDCPNAPELKRRFGYRIVRAQWSGKGSSQYSITLRVVGNDDIGIVSNITNIISKDEKANIRSINIDSHDGLFSGNIEVMAGDTARVASIIKKLRTIKGVKQVERI